MAARAKARRAVSRELSATSVQRTARPGFPIGPGELARTVGLAQAAVAEDGGDARAGERWGQRGEPHHEAEVVRLGVAEEALEERLLVLLCAHHRGALDWRRRVTGLAHQDLAVEVLAQLAVVVRLQVVRDAQVAEVRVGADGERV